jgi:hypothetical protein
MKLDRRIVGRKRQLLLPVPPEVRDHLSVIAGAQVWWHIGRKGQAVITMTGRSRGGRPAKDEDCPSCAKYRAELDRYRRELREGDSATPAQLFRQGYLQAVAQYGQVADRMDAQREMLRDLRAMVRELVKRGPGAPPDPARNVHEEARSAARPIPGPSLPSLPSEQGADSSGRQPQESHSES